VNYVIGFNAFSNYDFKDLVREGEVDELIDIVANDQMHQLSHYG
jgi:cell division septum initiation protein DivIVA